MIGLCLSGEYQDQAWGIAVGAILSLGGLAAAARILIYVGKPIDPAFPERGRLPRAMGGVLTAVSSLFVLWILFTHVFVRC